MQAPRSSFPTQMKLVKLISQQFLQKNHPKNFKLSILTTFTIAFLQQNIALAQETALENSQDHLNLIAPILRTEIATNDKKNDHATQIIITAQKMPITLKDVTQSATLYQLDTNNNSYDVLRDIPSLGATSAGNYGGQTSLFIRGGASNHNLVLLNGVPINQLSSGIASIERIPFKQFRQLEVVRGNVSAIYGSAAMSGVVNLTQKADQRPVTLEADIGLGTHGSRYTGTKFGQYTQTDDGYWAYDISFNHENRHQQSAMDANPSQKININPDRDGMRQNSTAANFYYQKNRYQSQFHALFNDDKINYDKEMYNTSWLPDPIGSRTKHYSKGRLGYYHLIQQLQMTPQLLFKLDNALVQDNSHEYQKISTGAVGNSPLWVDTLKQRTLFNALELRYKPLAKHTLIAQAETNFQKIDADSYGYAKYKFNQRNTKGGRLAYLYQDDLNRVDANFRRDWISEGNKNIHANSYYLAAAHYLTPALQIGVTHGQAFKAPTFNDLYGKWSANPNLQAEKSKTYEAFARYGVGGLTLRTSIYKTKYKDLIAYDKFYMPQNINRATAEGIEQSATWQTPYFEGGLFANYQNMRDDTAQKPILRRPHLMARLNLAYKTHLASMPIKLGGDIYYRGKSKDYIGYTIGKLPAYSIVGIFAQADVQKNTTARLAVNNLFNKKAQEVYGYPILSRNVMLDLKYKF